MGDEPYTIETISGVIVISFVPGTEVTPGLVIEVIRRENEFQSDDLKNALWDFRGCLPSDNFGYDAVERIINFVSNYPEIKWNPKLAILAEEGVQYGLSRMYQTLVDEFPTEIGIFHERTAALLWVTDKTVEKPREKQSGGVTD